MDVMLRPYLPDTDEAYVYSTWAKYSYYSPVTPIHTPKGQWFTQKAKEISEILYRSKVSVACLASDPFVIVGYVVVMDGEKQWMCVKKDYQGQGIESLLEKQIPKKEIRHESHLEANPEASREPESREAHGDRDPSQPSVV